MSDTPRVNIILGQWVEPLAKAETQAGFTSALKATLKALIDEAKDMERSLAKINGVLARNLTPSNKIKAIEQVIANTSLHGRTPAQGGQNE